MGSIKGPATPDSGLAIVLGAALDGVPESVVLGLSFSAGEGIGLAFLVAVFLSNLPEGIAGTAGLLTGGWARGRIIGLWLIVVAASAVAAFVGATVLAGTRGEVYAFILGFAGGAILTMLSDTLIPEAFEHAGKAGRTGHDAGVRAGVRAVVPGLASRRSSAQLAGRRRVVQPACKRDELCRRWRRSRTWHAFNGAFPAR